jgi:hypothetical protein
MRTARSNKAAGPRTLHRNLGIAVSALLIYFAGSGVVVQAIDLVTLLRHAPATAPNMMAIRESLDGPDNFAVIAPRDYAVAALPADLDPVAALARIAASLCAEAGGRPLRYVELRMDGRRPVGEGATADRVLRADARTGAVLADAPRPPASNGPASSGHLLAKRWHRLWLLGDWMLWINALAGIALGIMVLSGLRVYFQLLRARARAGRRSPFWRTGGRWRMVHRNVALVAAAFLAVVSVSGTLLSIDSFALQVAKATHPDQLVHGTVLAGMVNDYSSPLPPPVRLAAWARSTMAAFRAEGEQGPIKVLRLRYFAGIAQGVIVTGDGEVRQRVFDADSGRAVTSTEPGYPLTGFPFGWHEHEIMKRIHRGDIIGLPGRLMDLFAGLSLLFLAGSGLWLYLEQYRKLKRVGRSRLFWS